MTSHLRRKFDQRPTFCSTTPHFFKVILDDTCRDRKLGIPEDFVCKYGKDLSNPVCFKLPCGSEWEVGLTRYNGEVWLKNGWPDFSKFYSLGYNDMLVFRYEGNSRFQVSIFDRSTIEIEYPIEHSKIEESEENDDLYVQILEEVPPCPRKTREKFQLPSHLPHKKYRTSSSDTAKINLSFEKSMKNKEAHSFKSEIEYPIEHSKIEESEENDDSSVEILEEVPPCPRKTREKYQLPSHLPHKKNRTSSSDTAKINFSFEKSMKNKEPHSSKSEMKSKDDFPVKKEWGGTSSTQRFQKRTPEVHQKANAFKSHNPSFTMSIRHSYINQNLMWLPFKFGRTYLTKQPSSALLCGPGGSNTWSVALKYEPTTKRASFHTGWVKFLKGNDVKVNDVCVFVLIDDIRLLFEVIVEAANCSMPSDIDEDDINEDDVDEGIEDNKDNENGSDDADEDEDNEGEEDDDSIEILDHFPPVIKRKEKSPLAPRLHKRRRTTSSTKSQSHMKHVGGCSRTQKSLNLRPEVHKKIHPVNMESVGKYIALKRANAFKSVHPHFAVTLRPSYIRGNYMWLPAVFVHGHLIKRPVDAILQVSGGKSWPVRFHYNKERTTLQVDFIDFVRGNNLKAGDACVFVLTDNIKFLFDVFIFRAT